ncbi:hypothetical protein [Mesorhizobium sp. INR15]|uniref:hypothetical protein n=1 Tax=Mesorhizobium sp. INR15 TaxID=2654248 RepID=UPI0018966FA5|nr:hypothetical protein [Mesorhizobium sp. INR15]QPC93574.1 hypothetical protein GA829_25015 [Mesorhizobium sp. INR15]
MKTSPLRNVALSAVAVWTALSAGPSLAEPKTETSGKWSATVDELSSGQDVHKTCAASTAFVDQNGSPGTVTLIISSDDALPPNAYPALTLAVDNKDLPKGNSIATVFSDGKGKVAATVSEGDSIGPHRQWIMDNKPKTSLALLRAMRQASTLDVTLASIPVASIEMTGFTKAYRNLGTWCGFPTGDVAP